MTDTVNTHREARSADSYLEWVTRREASVWRWLLLIPIFLLTLLLGPALALPLTLVLPDSQVGDLVATLSQFPGTLLVFAGLAALALWRPVWMFAFRRRSPEWGLFGTGVAIQVAVTLGMTLLYWAVGILDLNYARPDVQLVLVLVPIAVVGILIQTGTEEFIVRGGLTQMMFRMTSNPVVVIVLPAIAFAALHISNLPEGSGVFAYSPYFVQGLLLGWVAWRTGSIWFSWGLHFANNAFLTLVIGNPDDVYESVSGVTFELTSSSDTVLAVVDISSTAAVAVVALLVLRRRPNMGALARARRAGEPSRDRPVRGRSRRASWCPVSSTGTSAVTAGPRNRAREMERPATWRCPGSRPRSGPRRSRGTPRRRCWPRAAGRAPCPRAG
jgi:membrane protease YdiL (CAAX protease family)